MPFDVKLTDISIPLSGDDELRGVLAVPDGEGPFPAVVMVHEVFGIDESMRSQITRMASAGYLVLMPNLYSRGGMRKCLKATFRALVDGVGQAYVDVEAAKQLLLSRPDCTGKIGVVGFCMGGGTEISLACRYRVAATDARIGLPEIKLGIFPGWGGSARLPRLVGALLVGDRQG